MRFAFLVLDTTWLCVRWGAKVAMVFLLRKKISKNWFSGLQCYDSLKINCSHVRKLFACNHPLAKEYCPRSCQLCKKTATLSGTGSFLQKLPEASRIDLRVSRWIAELWTVSNGKTVQASVQVSWTASRHSKQEKINFSRNTMRVYCARSCGEELR